MDHKIIIGNKTIYFPFIILSGIACNSACIMCAVRTQRPDQLNASTEQIMDDIARGRKENYERLEISGGEPTLRRDLVSLIEQAKELGYKEIGMCTNGILLSEKDYCDKLIKAGLTSITFSLYAHNKKLHETITRSPGSFEKTITGIKNAVRHNNLEFTATSVIIKNNYQHIYEVGKLIVSLGIKYWKISELLPNFLQKDQYIALSISKKQNIKALRSLKLLLDDIELFTFYGFTPCMLPSDLLQIKKFRWVSGNELYDIGQFVRYTGKNITQENLTKIDICEDCIYSAKCSGIWKRYLDYFGDKEIRELAYKHNCIKVDNSWLIVN